MQPSTSATAICNRAYPQEQERRQARRFRYKQAYEQMKLAVDQKFALEALVIQESFLSANHHLSHRPRLTESINPHGTSGTSAATNTSAGR